MEDNGVSEFFEESKKGKFKAPTKSKESVLKQKSPAEFFAENKNIAGFDNPGKSLYTTVRELVENSLDSAESISELPSIEVTIEEINKMEFNTMIGLVDRERVDEELYDYFESAKVREKRLAKQARFQEIQAKNASMGKKAKEPSTNTKGPKGRGETSFFKVICKDNGRGMPHDDIPNMFGRVLSGTKYGLKQTRGKFGLGAKMRFDHVIAAIEESKDISRMKVDELRSSLHVHEHVMNRWKEPVLEKVIEDVKELMEDTLNYVRATPASTQAPGGGDFRGRGRGDAKSGDRALESKPDQ